MIRLTEAEKSDRLSIVGGRLLRAIADECGESDRNSDKPAAIMRNQREEALER
jgi:hypothetical protein